MSKLFHTKLFVFLPLLLAVLLVGCSHQKTQRGHLFRGDWAIEYNRTPWIGCPPDSGCPEDEADTEKSKLFSCLAKDPDQKKRKGARRACGTRRGCSPLNPCCQTLGCGMWVEPGDAVPAATTGLLGGSVQSCGLTPLCAPQKPCGLTPNCGKPASVNLQGGNLQGVNLQAANARSLAPLRGMNLAGIRTNELAGVVPGTTLPGTLVSRGIVPGASAITTGGMVAAIGVTTPAGTMTPVGVRMPNGMVNNNVVLRACAMSPSCTAAQPCGLTPHCGGAVAVNAVANNAVALASALQAQGVAGGVMQAGGMGLLANPVTGQPIHGLTMSGYPQTGYPPIGYSPTGYAPGYPQGYPQATGMIGVGISEEEEEEEIEEPVLPGTRSAMPVPRFHPVPSKPTFQRSEGMSTTAPSSSGTRRSVSVAKPTTVASGKPVGTSHVWEEELESALDQAYLEGVSAAMSEVERKMEAQRQAAAKAKLQERILQQAAHVQQQLEEQERARMLAMQQAQRERQLRQQAAQQAVQQSVQPSVQPSGGLTMAEMVQEPQRLPTQKQASATTGNNAGMVPASLAESLKNANAGGMLTSLFGSNQTRQTPAQNSSKPRSAAESAARHSTTPGKPPVSPVPPAFGLSTEDSEPGPLILQAQFQD